MSNYVILNDGQDYGTKTGRIASVVQGEVGKVLLIDVQDAAGNDFSITNATSFVGRMETPAGAVTTVTGAITVSGGGISWEMSSGDVGTAGRFSVLFQFTLSGDIYKTHPVTLNIIADPAATEVQGDTNVTIPQSEATWLTAEKTAIEAADTGEILESDGTNSRGTNYLTATSLRKNNYTAVTAPGVGDDTGDGYAPGSRWIDTVGDESYTCVDATLGAAIWKSATSAGIANVVEDTTPQLGGDLDLNGNVITGMVIGTDIQAYSAKTAAIAALTWAANNIILLTGTATASVQALAAHVVTFIQSATAGDSRTAIGAAASADLSTHEGLTVTAHGGLIPQDALIISKTEGYQVASGDAGKIIECSGTFSVTFPNGLDTGFQVTVVNVGAGVITLAASTTLQSDGTQLETQYTGASVYHRGSNVWLALGRLT